MRKGDGGSQFDGRRSRFPLGPEHGLEKEYECYTNDVSSSRQVKVYREDKQKYKGTQSGLIMNDEDVDALLKRKPNSVKNIIKSLNSQMRQKSTPNTEPESNVVVPTSSIEPEFGKEIQECNVSVKNRIHAFDKLSARTRRKIQPSYVQPTYVQPTYVHTQDDQSCISYPTSPSIRSGQDTGCRLWSDGYKYFKERSNWYNDEENQYESSARSVGRLNIGDQFSGRRIHDPDWKMTELWKRGFGRSRERNHTDILMMGSRSDGEYGHSTMRVPRCNSDICYNSARDPFGPLHKEWNRNLRLSKSQFNEGGKMKHGEYSSHYGCSPDGDPVSFDDEMNPGSPLLSGMMGDPNAAQRLELPLEAGCRDLDVNPVNSDGLSIDTKPCDECIGGEPSYAHSFTVKTSKGDITLRSVNIIKAEWTWMHSSRARKWCPKYLVLFYDDVKQHLPYQIRAAVRTRRNAYDDYGDNTGSFWDIYKIYSHIGNARKAMAPPFDRDCRAPTEAKTAPNNGMRNMESPRNTTRSQAYNAWNPNYMGRKFTMNDPMNELGYAAINPGHVLLPGNTESVVIIPDGSRVFLTILRNETDDLMSALENGEFQELMEVDVDIIPYTKQHAPRNWLADLIARSMGRDPLNLIHIPLVNGYECCFMPICAADFCDIPLSYKMECARQKRIGKEYEQWIFTLWEYVLRNRKYKNDNPSYSREKLPQNKGLTSTLRRTIRDMFSMAVTYWSGSGDDSADLDCLPTTENEDACLLCPEEQSALRRYT